MAEVNKTCQVSLQIVTIPINNWTFHQIMVKRINLKFKVFFPKFCVIRNCSEDKLHKWKTPNCCMEQRAEQQPLSCSHRTLYENVDWDQSTWTFVTVDFNSAVSALKCPDLHSYRAALANALWNPAKHMEVPSFSSLKNQFLVVQFYLHCESWALQALEESLQHQHNPGKLCLIPTATFSYSRGTLHC